MSARQLSGQGFIGTCVGVAVNPAPTMRTIVRRRPVGWAILVIVVVYAGQGVAQAVSLGQYDFRDVEWLLGPIRVAPSS